MAASALEIVRNVAAVVGIADLSSVVGNNEPHARAMLVLLNRAGRAMARKRNSWGATWVTLTREFEFDTVPGQEAYDFPEDFQALVEGTVWDRDSYREARGPLTPKEWQTVKSGLIETTSITPNYRLRAPEDGVGRQLVLDPVPTTNETIVIEYSSRFWVVSADGETFRDAIAEDTDITVYDDDLIEMNLLARFKQSRGLSFAAELAEFELEEARMFAEDAGMRKIHIGRQPSQSLFHRDQIPETIPRPSV